MDEFTHKKLDKTIIRIRFLKEIKVTIRRPYNFLTRVFK